MGLRGVRFFAVMGKAEGSSVVPDGTRFILTWEPSVETLGYCLSPWRAGGSWRQGDDLIGRVMPLQGVVMHRYRLLKALPWAGGWLALRAVCVC